MAARTSIDTFSCLRTHQRDLCGAPAHRLFIACECTLSSLPLLELLSQRCSSTGLVILRTHSFTIMCVDKWDVHSASQAAAQVSQLLANMSTDARVRAFMAHCAPSTEVCLGCHPHLKFVHSLFSLFSVQFVQLTTSALGWTTGPHACVGYNLPSDVTVGSDWFRIGFTAACLCINVSTWPL